MCGDLFSPGPTPRPSGRAAAEGAAKIVRGTDF